ncbi:SDR family NAD(P)-dependent oxidoreductase [Streptomyces sp. NPDC046197]|uniref:SDR family NAD(P)-dependent oxidoreductase n=1 Tax=Streptomyces sp. NPDC046197 TaxID=3154337 RepID=UPI0033FF8347
MKTVAEGQRGAVVVTGASSGFGRQVARVLAERGFTVIALVRRGAQPAGLARNTPGRARARARARRHHRVDRRRVPVSRLDSPPPDEDLRASAEPRLDLRSRGDWCPGHLHRTGPARGRVLPRAVRRCCRPSPRRVEALAAEAVARCLPLPPRLNDDLGTLSYRRKKRSIVIVCGLHLTHDGAIALADDGRLVFSVEMRSWPTPPATARSRTCAW